MATLVEDKYSAAFAILLSSLSVAFSDVVSLLSRVKQEMLMLIRIQE
jgi:hypothetical protein